jgi:hypothetical protein
VSERELPVARSAKKPKVKERTIAERKYCAVDQFYYSEMFTCPICYGADRELERIEQLLPDIIRLGNIDYLFDIDDEMPELVQEAKALIKGEQK